MTFKKNLAIDDRAGPDPIYPITYHQQDRPQDGKSYCGAAAAQMVLNSIGASLLEQDELYELAKSHSKHKSKRWFCAPDGLLQAIEEKRKSAGFRTSFVLCEVPCGDDTQEATARDAISRKICWAIHHHGVAPIVLVSGGRHWIVVTGYEASQPPAHSTDPSYKIEKLFVYNPFPEIPLDVNVPPHANGSDGCGTVYGKEGLLDRGNAAAELLNEESESIPTWVDFMSPMRDKFIAIICDPDASSTISGDSPPDTDHDEDIHRANRRVTDVRSDQPEPRIRPRDGTHPNNPIMVEVEREDVAPLRLYAIELRGLTKKAVLERFKVVEVRGKTVMLREEDLYERLVWRPCVESLSPDWPFYRFDVGGSDGEIKVYVRIDGALFPELHVGMGM